MHQQIHTKAEPQQQRGHPWVPGSPSGRWKGPGEAQANPPSAIRAAELEMPQCQPSDTSHGKGGHHKATPGLESPVNPLVEDRAGYSHPSARLDLHETKLGEHWMSQGEGNQTPSSSPGTLAPTQAVTWELSSAPAPPSPSATGRTQGHTRRGVRNRSQDPAFLCLNNSSSQTNLPLSFWCVRNSVPCLLPRAACVGKPQVPWGKKITSCGA